MTSNFKINTPYLLEIDGKLFYYDTDNFGEIRIEGSTITNLRYISKGLEGNQITCICKHNNRYYCTTQTGVFYIEENTLKRINTIVI
ncbi:MAG: hypothetical protein R2852_09980 [Bacteroidia bacterium]